MINQSRDTRIYSEKNKKPELDQILDRRMYVIVNRLSKPMCHRDGHLLIFYKKKEAMRWLEENKNEDEKWRVRALRTSLMTV